MFKSKLSKVIVSLLRRIAGVTRSGAKRLMRAMLRSLMAMGRRARLPMAGFVLPTVTMVLLVVILLTVAITLRSFDRANTARNVRVNQQVLAAATPALDRAKQKFSMPYPLKEAEHLRHHQT
jgi:type II secretory pathway pseudopilin PulG